MPRPPGREVGTHDVRASRCLSHSEPRSRRLSNELRRLLRTDRLIPIHEKDDVAARERSIGRRRRDDGRGSLGQRLCSGAIGAIGAIGAVAAAVAVAVAVTAAIAAVVIATIPWTGPVATSSASTTLRRARYARAPCACAYLRLIAVRTRP